MASSAICKDDVQGYPDAHLLGIALELRQKIYAYILTDIHSEPRDWEKVPTSSYDGLRYVCKQLCLEIKDSVFAHLIPKVSLDVVSKLSVNKTNVHKFRSLYLEMGLDFAEWWYFDLSRLLNQFQLSLQELHLIFTGLDELGGKTGLVDCGNHQRARVYPMLPLSKKGQGAEKKLKMLRHIVDLRNLTVLQIKNLNFAIPAAIVLRQGTSSSSKCHQRPTIEDDRPCRTCKEKTQAVQGSHCTRP